MTEKKRAPEVGIFVRITKGQKKFLKRYSYETGITMTKLFKNMVNRLIMKSGHKVKEEIKNEHDQKITNNGQPE